MTHTPVSGTSQLVPETSQCVTGFWYWFLLLPTVRNRTCSILLLAAGMKHELWYQGSTTLGFQRGTQTCTQLTSFTEIIVLASLRITPERIRVKTETEIADEQAGFRQGRGTRDQITNLRILMHKAREHQQPLYMCFVDFKKAFDSISHDKLWVTMMDMEYPIHLIDLLAKLYKKQLAKVKVAGTLSEWFRVKKGVRQGCVISPYLFNIPA